MCFHIHPSHKEKKRATKDIVVYKLLRKNSDEIKNYCKLCNRPIPQTEWVTLFQYTDVNFNELKRAKFSYNSFRDIEEGLHSYSTINKAKCYCFSVNKKVFKSIIPKGAYYYYNPNTEEYVSTQLLIKEKQL